MKALIFNSGLGSRLGSLTTNKPKSMVRLSSGETILERQLRILESLGIKDYVITTGPYANQIEAACEPYREKGCSFAFVNNPLYAETNYIYSMWLARDHLRDTDCLMLHGDLVFDRAYAYRVIHSSEDSLGSVNSSIPQPEKDFKARVANGRVEEVSVEIFESDCIAFQPFYKLSEKSIQLWLEAISAFINCGEVSVYAENAANTVFRDMNVKAFSYEGYFVEEVDTPEDLERVSRLARLFDYREQPVYELRGDTLELHEGFSERRSCSIADLCMFENPLIVCSSRYDHEWISDYFDSALSSFVQFDRFSCNPTYEEALLGYEVFCSNACDALISIGGGTAIDIAKVIKTLDAKPDHRLFNGSSLAKVSGYSDLLHIAIPTTAGTGSESTHFAVIYKDGIKNSVSYEWLLPDIAILDPALLSSLSDYQKKCTLLDAFCQAIESYWAASSCEESRGYASTAISLIMENYQMYLDGDPHSASNIMRAANLAGKAINITTTTAPHALSYKLTSMRGIPHGHAVALCMTPCWGRLINALQKATVDDANLASLERRLSEISALISHPNDSSPIAGMKRFYSMICELGLGERLTLTQDEIDILSMSVNTQRLNNFPIRLERDAIAEVYKEL